MEKILTLVIPTYNMEKYLRKCLDSLVVSQESMELLEVLIINDGSVDNSLSIAKEFVQRYPHTFRVIDKENGNYGSCVNRGLKESTGKYIKILDADDSFENKYFEEFIVFLKNIDVDLIISGYNKVNETGDVVERHSFGFPSRTILDFREYCTMASVKQIQMHAVTYRTENLKRIKYRQTEGISYTDQEWIFIPLTTINHFSYFNQILYLYLVGREGQTMDDDVIVKSMNQYRKMIFSLVQEYETRPSVSDELDELLRFKLVDKIKFIYNRALLRKNLSLDFLSEFDSDLKNKSAMVYKITQDAGVYSLFPYKFINYYRKNKRYLPFYVNWIYRLIRG